MKEIEKKVLKNSSDIIGIKKDIKYIKSAVDGVNESLTDLKKTLKIEFVQNITKIETGLSRFMEKEDFLSAMKQISERQNAQSKRLSDLESNHETRLNTHDKVLYAMIVVILVSIAVGLLSVGKADGWIALP